MRIGQFFKSMLEGGRVDVTRRYEVLREGISGTMSNFHMARDRQTGQVVGATDSHGGEPTDRPVQYREIFATLYHQLGLDPHQLVLDHSEGRPYDLLDGAKPIGELI